MRGEMIDVRTEDGVADAYLARPDDHRGPAVLLVMDAFGLRPQIERMADRVAAVRTEPSQRRTHGASAETLKHPNGVQITPTAAP